MEDLWAETILHSPKLYLIYPDRLICWQLLCAASEDVHTRPILASPPHQQEALGPAGKGLGGTEKSFPYAAGL